MVEFWERTFDDDRLHSSEAKTVRKMATDLYADCQFYPHLNVYHHSPIIGF